MYLCHILRWHRYINDIMIIWQGSETLLKEFVAKLNVNTYNLTFTVNHDRERLEFLDIELRKDQQGFLTTTLFRKQTASNSFLHAKSMHPPRCIEGIPKGQYLRLRRICSSEEEYKREAYKLYQRFKTRGYKTRCLRRAYQGALATNREDLLYNPHGQRNPITKPTNQGQTRLILTFNNNDRDVRSVIHKHWDTLTRDPALGRLVSPHPLITYKRNTSIGDLLTHSHYQRGSKRICCKIPGNFRCGACEQCQFLKMSSTFGNDQSKFDMFHHISCTTTFVVYLFTCHCGSMYVGKTIRMLKRRIYEHIRDIKNCNLTSSIAKHCSHNGQYSGCFFQGIDRLHGDIRGGDLENRLLQLETSWIFRLNTYKSEFGLNGQLNFQAFIHK
ncbi:hypothetical protein XELAEV_18008899mg [Xenopus laevis]|uniref:GIY-YIG domain-containing protein n=1 Tax=Xenopus laevis TaxID=8355 RepID=A0A974DRK9_XENLA|nr:hypothetical protein XELAEV_18008899mg [Xenopus laevis]